mmetsp:Transcript_1167/g.2686  ORF Transcript_1167/g.2686 Transcript_1167/m.2686 type:complete len:80 (-) Transcript_1167:1238-1477(-)
MSKGNATTTTHGTIMDPNKTACPPVKQATLLLWFHSQTLSRMVAFKAVSSQADVSRKVLGNCLQENAVSMVLHMEGHRV